MNYIDIQSSFVFLFAFAFLFNFIGSHIGKNIKLNTDISIHLNNENTNQNGPQNGISINQSTPCEAGSLVLRRDKTAEVATTLLMPSLYHERRVDG